MTAQPTANPPTDGGYAQQQPVRRLYRSRSNRVLAGICGGIAEYYGSDPRAVRLLALLIGLFTGIFPAIIVYLVAAVVLPEGTGASVVEGAPSTGVSSLGLVLGALLIVVGVAGIASVWLRIEWDAMWPLVLVALGTVLLVTAMRGRGGDAT